MNVKAHTHTHTHTYTQVHAMPSGGQCKVSSSLSM